MNSIEVRLRAELRTLAEFLQADVAALSRKLGAVVVESEPIYADDQALVDVLVASAEGNLATLVQVFRYELDLGTVDAPPAAIHFARRLAQRGIPVSVLARAYRLGQQCVMAYFHEKLDDRFTDVELAAATYRHLSGIAFHYADRVTEQAIVAYDDEARMWLRNDAAMQTAHIRSLLAGGPIDVAATEQALRYRLRRRHLGIVAWIADSTSIAAPLAEIEKVTARIAKQTLPDAQPLFVARDERSAFLWLPVGEQPVEPSELAAMPGPLGECVRIGVGTPGSGPDGFRTTMREALTALEVVQRAGSTAPRVVPYLVVAPISMLSRDMDLARSWVLDVLGPLARDDEPTATIRHTLQVFLANAGGLRPTADRLVVHKNTVTYRVHKAEELLGRPVNQDRLRVELALLACHWLGSAVLTPNEAVQEGF
ncbi:PucR family transcriptional regulator [Streptomyces sp. NPDC004561]